MNEDMLIATPIRLFHFVFFDPHTLFYLNLIYKVNIQILILSYERQTVLSVINFFFYIKVKETGVSY